jgi:hypothetical protein
VRHPFATPKGDPGGELLNAVSQTSSIRAAVAGPQAREGAQRHEDEQADDDRRNDREPVAFDSVAADATPGSAAATPRTRRIRCIPSDTIKLV